MKKRKPMVIILGGLLVAGLCYVGGWFYFLFSGHSGTVKNVMELGPVYQACGPDHAAFYTNSFLHKLRFTVPIHWQSGGMRPDVTITGQVDVVAFRREMANEPFIDFSTLYWDSAGTNTLYYFKMVHRVHRSTAMITRGTLDTATGNFKMSSQTPEMLMDDYEWHKLTNSRMVDFIFDAPKQ